MSFKIVNHEVNNCPSEMRLDRYLRLLNSTLTQGIIEQAIRKKEIRLNNLKCKSSNRVTNGDVLNLTDIYFESSLAKAKAIPNGAKKLSDRILNELLILDHPEFIIINKPSGLATQSGSNITLSVDDALNFLNNTSTEENNFIKGLRLVHRLDKDTSGILLIAKNKISAAALTDAFKNRLIHKEYLAILSGVLVKNKGRIISKLTKDIINKKQRVSDDGIEAITDYEVISTTEKYSLILFKPITGRMHQLRLHALEIGHPIVGDNKYNPIRTDSNLLLHAHKIIIPSSIFGKKIEIEARLPKYFNAILN